MAAHAANSCAHNATDRHGRPTVITGHKYGSQPMVSITIIREFRR